MLSLFFTKDSFGDSFFEKNEFKELKQIFKKLAQGLRIVNHHEEIILYFKSLKKATKLERFIVLLQILKAISSAETKPLSNFVYQKKYSDLEGKKMRTIFEYTIANAHKSITLDEIANVANMTKNAFCTYFKKRTNKTYISFLTELRIENACKLLQAQKENSIADIAFKTGFHNISNFNRQFKKTTGYSPTNYIKAHLSLIS